MNSDEQFESQMWSDVAETIADSDSHTSSLFSSIIFCEALESR